MTATLAEPRPGRARGASGVQGGAKSAVLRLVRRVHLFSGLCLAPWVLLYGVSAFLFNHPAVLGGIAERELTGAELARLRPAGAADARVLADELFAELRARTPELEACAPAPSLTGRWVFQGSDESSRHTLAFDVEGERGLWRTSSVEPEPPQPEFLEDVAARDAWVPRAAARDLLGELGLASSELRLRDAPILRFGVREGEREWLVEHDPAEGELRAYGAGEERAALDPLELLMELHTTHGRTGTSGAPRAWSWIVDALALSMVGWALSGIVMWWQIPRVRRVGLWLLAACGSLAIVLATAMRMELLS